jgi:DNA polymerase III delta' subunit
LEKVGKLGVLGAAGCTTVQDRLFRYLKSQRIHPALLFIGPDKEVKFQAAKGIAKFLFCSKKSNKAYCGECNNCKRIEKEIHPDVYFFKEDSEETLKIEVVREVIGQMRVTPIEGPYKICVIEEAHRMNSAAANAFLKTLEEPGEGRFFILTTTQSGSILPTVSSRCIEFVFRPENDGIKIPEELQKKYRDLLIEAAKTKNYSLVSQSLDEKEDALKFLQFLQSEIYQSLMAKEAGKPSAPLFNASSPHELTLTFEALVTAEGQLRSNANYALMIESLLRNHFSGVNL